MDCPEPGTRPELGTKCPDPEACQTGWPCARVRALANPSKKKEMDMTQQDIEKAKDAIEDWWLENARQAIEAVAPKAAEYGSTDLAELGRDLAMLMNRDGMSHEELTELGIYMYMLGKFSRWRDAIKDGRRVSLDTIYDIKVYATMAERNRAVGGWPFPIDHEEQK